MCTSAAVATVQAISGIATAAGQIQEGNAAASMYRYQGQLSAQQAKQLKETAKSQAKLIEDTRAQNAAIIKETAESNIIAIQGQAADKTKKLGRDVSRVTGAQKAALGAAGVGGVTAEDIAAGTFDIAKLDELSIRYNADLNAFSINTQARSEIRALNIRARNEAFLTTEEAKQRASALEGEARGSFQAADIAKSTGKRKAFTSLLGTASSVATNKFLFDRKKKKAA